MSRLSLTDRFARLLSRKRNTGSSLWQDREIRFDLSSKQLKPIPGEFIVSSLENVEDSKGQKYEVGWLYVTNLRTIWNSTNRRRLNISIGHRCVIESSFASDPSRLKGEYQTITILTAFFRSNYEFTFCSLETDTVDVYDELRSVLDQYRRSRLYRDLAIRGQFRGELDSPDGLGGLELISRDCELIELEGERMIESLKEVHNLSCDDVSLGRLFLTNYRIVWISKACPEINISVPYIQLKDVKIRDSKFGKAIVIETSEECGGYVLGFRLDLLEEMERLREEIEATRELFNQNPFYGIEERVPKSEVGTIAELPSPDKDEVEDRKGDAFAIYCENLAADHPPVYSSYLGLAVEALPEGMTIEDLWNVV